MDFAFLETAAGCFDAFAVTLYNAALSGLAVNNAVVASSPTDVAIVFDVPNNMAPIAAQFLDHATESPVPDFALNTSILPLPPDSVWTIDFPTSCYYYAVAIVPVSISLEYCRSHCVSPYRWIPYMCLYCSGPTSKRKFLFAALIHSIL